MLNKKNNATLAIDTIPSLTLLHSIYSSVSMKKIMKTNLKKFDNKLNNA